MNVEDIRDRIASVMKWDRKEVDKFSLPTLRSFVRGKDPNLDRILTDVIDNQLHWFVKEDS